MEFGPWCAQVRDLSDRAVAVAGAGAAVSGVAAVDRCGGGLHLGEPVTGGSTASVVVPDGVMTRPLRWKVAESAIPGFVIARARKWGRGGRSGIRAESPNTGRSPVLCANGHGIACPGRLVRAGAHGRRTRRCEAGATGPPDGASPFCCRRILAASACSVAGPVTTPAAFSEIASRRIGRTVEAGTPASLQWRRCAQRAQGQKIVLVSGDIEVHRVPFYSRPPDVRRMKRCLVPLPPWRTRPHVRAGRGSVRSRRTRR